MHVAGTRGRGANLNNLNLEHAVFVYVWLLMFGVLCFCSFVFFCSKFKYFLVWERQLTNEQSTLVVSLCMSYFPANGNSVILLSKKWMGWVIASVLRKARSEAATTSIQSYLLSTYLCRYLHNIEVYILFIHVWVASNKNATCVQ